MWICYTFYITLHYQRTIHRESFTFPQCWMQIRSDFHNGRMNFEQNLSCLDEYAGSAHGWLCTQKEEPPKSRRLRRTNSIRINQGFLYNRRSGVIMLKVAAGVSGRFSRRFALVIEIPTVSKPVRVPAIVGGVERVLCFFVFNLDDHRTNHDGRLIGNGHELELQNQKVIVDGDRVDRRHR